MKKRFGGTRIRIYLATLSLVLYIFTKISVRFLSARKLETLEEFHFQEKGPKIFNFRIIDYLSNRRSQKRTNKPISLPHVAEERDLGMAMRTF